MTKLVKGEVTLKDRDIEELKRALAIIPDEVEGEPYVAKVRRGEIERRRLSLIKAQVTVPGQVDSQELYKLCRWKGEFVTVGWALRSRLNGDYHVYSEVW